MQRRIYQSLSSPCRLRDYHCTLVLSLDSGQKAPKTPGKLSVANVHLSESSSGYNRLLDSVKQRTGLDRREQFSLALNEFLVREKFRKGHVSFMRTAMRRMDDFGLDKDLETYNKLINVFPRKRFAPIRLLDAFWPRSTPQMELCLDILTKMEEKGIRPSLETYHLVKTIFGRTWPLEKCISIMYYFDKYKDIDPYEIKTQLPTNPVELSRLCLFRMGGIDTHLLEVQVPEGDVGTDYIISGHSAKQWKRLETLKDRDLSHSVFLHVDGPSRIWLKKVEQFYFTLRVSGAEEILTEVETEGLMLGMCMCLPYSQDRLQRWMGSLYEHWPGLAGATIVYNMSAPVQQQHDAKKPLLLVER